MDSELIPAADRQTLPDINRATGDAIGTVARAEHTDLARTLAEADKAFAGWRKVSPYERARIRRKAPDMSRRSCPTTPGLVPPAPARREPVPQRPTGPHLAETFLGPGKGLSPRRRTFRARRARSRHHDRADRTRRVTAMEASLPTPRSREAASLRKPRDAMVVRETDAVRYN